MQDPRGAFSPFVIHDDPAATGLTQGIGGQVVMKRAPRWGSNPHPQPLWLAVSNNMAPTGRAWRGLYRHERIHVRPKRRIQTLCHLKVHHNGIRPHQQPVRTCLRSKECLIFLWDEQNRLSQRQQSRPIWVDLSIVGTGTQAHQASLLYVLRTGCQWRALPRDFPKWSTVYSYFSKWNAPRDGGSLLEQALKKSAWRGPRETGAGCMQHILIVDALQREEHRHSDA